MYRCTQFRDHIYTRSSSSSTTGTTAQPLSSRLLRLLSVRWERTSRSTRSALGTSETRYELNGVVRKEWQKEDCRPVNREIEQRRENVKTRGEVSRTGRRKRIQVRHGLEGSMVSGHEAHKGSKNWVWGRFQTEPQDAVVHRVRRCTSLRVDTAKFHQERHDGPVGALIQYSNSTRAGHVTVFLGGFQVVYGK